MEIRSSKGIRDQIMSSEGSSGKYDNITTEDIRDYMKVLSKTNTTTDKRHWWLSGGDIMRYWPEIKDLDKNKVYMVEL